MPTTGGALAFAGLIPPYEATLTRNLREAGAIIIAKTTMTELANWVAAAMPTNYNSLSGFAFNPYDPRRDPREATGDGRPVLATGGSSSGIGTAMSFWAGQRRHRDVRLDPEPLQSEHAGRHQADGRTRQPVRRHPDCRRSGHAGPMARTVADAAIMLGALEGAKPDPNDPATSTCTPPPQRDYTKFLRREGLKGARLGIPRAFYYDAAATPGERGSNGGLNDAQRRVMTEAIAAMRAQGATIVDPGGHSVRSSRPIAARSLLTWGVCSGPDDAKGRDEDCSVVFKYGMKRDFNAWLASLGDRAPVKSLTALREWNRAHQSAGTLKYGQVQLDNSDEMDLTADRARYEADRAKDLALSRGERDRRGDEDAQARRAHLSRRQRRGDRRQGRLPDRHRAVRHRPECAGMPAGFNAKPSPYGVAFTGGACSEPRLIEMAYAFEQATKRRVPPRLD